MGQEADILVLGGGVAACMVAAHARQLGRRVTLINHATGATNLSSGAVDILDTLANIDADPFSSNTWSDKPTHITLEMHPYLRVPGVLEQLPQALALFQNVTSNIQMIRRDDEKNMVIATQLGTVKRCGLVQSSMHLDLGELRSDELVAIVDITGVLGFDASSVANMLNFIVSTSLSAKFKVATCSVELKSPQIFRNFTSFADYLDEGTNLEQFIESIDGALRPMPVKPKYLLFPPLLGKKTTRDVIRKIENRTQCVVRELLSMPPSIPGMRLQETMLVSLGQLGVEIVQGKALFGAVEHNTVQEVVVETGKSNVHYRPKSVVLASGRYAAGGIVYNSAAQESIFKLPIWNDKHPVQSEFVGHLTGQSVGAAHAIFSAGVRTDTHLRPLNVLGKVVAHNLFAAGSVLGGYDPTQDGTGMGVAIASGYLAGALATKA